MYQDLTTAELRTLGETLHSAMVTVGEVGYAEGWSPEVQVLYKEMSHLADSVWVLV